LSGQVNSNQQAFKIMTEKEKLEKEIGKLKKDLEDYLRIFQILGVTEKEKERVVNQYLDDILNRRERLKKLE
jgi:hypothetical protein